MRIWKGCKFPKLEFYIDFIKWERYGNQPGFAVCLKIIPIKKKIKQSDFNNEPIRIPNSWIRVTFVLCWMVVSYVM